MPHAKSWNGNFINADTCTEAAGTDTCGRHESSGRRQSEPEGGLLAERRAAHGAELENERLTPRHVAYIKVESEGVINMIKKIEERHK